ncbi:putative DNA-binding domain-containing protein [Benzoatithermus flavus]|uniref:DNA-binding domain-containing protein n=1 Tax=Benzoatithermus flavus TaxID=3108223 RepID=A0ABU8XSQ0_9PROT
MSPLHELQAAFARALLDPAHTGTVTGGIVAAGIAPERRLAIYRHNVLASLRRVLEGTFPATRRLLGARAFAELAERFVLAHPPDRPQLVAYGAGFPAFLREQRPEAAEVADVAALEWAREEACHAPDAAPLAPAALQAIPVERYPALRFLPHPSLRLIHSAGPVYSRWRAALDEVPEPAPNLGPEQVLVLRPAMTVTTRPIAAADAALLEALLAGGTLAEAAAEAIAVDAAFDLEAALTVHLTGGSFVACQ